MDGEKERDEGHKFGNDCRCAGTPMLDALEIKGLTPTENHNRSSTELSAPDLLPFKLGCT